jgi:hypothetical protein
MLKFYDSIKNLADARQYEDRLDFLINSVSSVNSSSRESVPTSGHLYEPLHSGTHIRLLELNPGGFDKALTFHFHIANLSSSHPEYEAVSYVWGCHSFSVRAPDRPSNIAMSGNNSVKISENLAELLRYLRYNNRSRMIWVDGLCINQHDKEERGHQVSLMSAIYHQARNVIVWLREINSDRFVFRSKWYKYTVCDDGDERTPREDQNVRGQLLFETICIIVNAWLAEHNLQSSAKYAVHSRRSQTQELRQLRLLPNVLRECLASRFNSITSHGRKWSLWDAIQDLYELPWFRRTWAVQELILAPCALAKFGNAEIDWRWIGLSAAILRTNDLEKIQYHAFGGVYNAYLLYRLSNMSDLPPLQLTSLQLMRLTRGLESTEVYDQVYGLLGISTTDNDPSTGNLLIRPDYGITHSMLWRKLACIFIELTNDLSILSSVQHARIETKNREKPPLRNLLHEDIPSWVPQWNEMTRASLLPWDAEEKFSASYGIPMVLKQPPDTGSLIIQCLRIGQVGSVLQGVRQLMGCRSLAKFFETKQGTKTLYRTLCAGRSPYGSLISKTPHGYMDSLFEIFSWHTINIDALIPGSYVHMYAVSHLTGECRWGDFSYRRRDEEDEVQAAKYKALVDQLGTNRQLCLTLNGYLILAPDVVQEGDILYILAGSSNPVLLRPLKAISRWHPIVQLSEDTSLKSNSNCFALVGECYVQGLMCGEAFRTLQKSSINQGPIPFDLVSKHVLASATKILDPDVVPWVKKQYSNGSSPYEYRELPKVDAEFINSILSRHEANKSEDQNMHETIKTYRVAIHHEQRLKTKLDWVEII